MIWVTKTETHVIKILNTKSACSQRYLIQRSLRNPVCDFKTIVFSNFCNTMLQNKPTCGQFYEIRSPCGDVRFIQGVRIQG